MFEAAPTTTSDDTDWTIPSIPTMPRRRRETAGYGACGNPDCECRGFAGGSGLCSNCGHQYQDHY